MMIAAPKQTRLLGATVTGLGLVVAVSSSMSFCYAILEGADKINRRVPLIDLKRDEVAFPLEAQPYRTQMERVGVGTWDEVHSLLPTPAAIQKQAITALIAPRAHETLRAA